MPLLVVCDVKHSQRNKKCAFWLDLFTSCSVYDEQKCSDSTDERRFKMRISTDDSNHEHLGGGLTKITSSYLLLPSQAFGRGLRQIVSSGLLVRTTATAFPPAPNRYCVWKLLKGLSMLQANMAVWHVVWTCLKAEVFIPVLNGHTRRPGKKPAVMTPLWMRRTTLWSCSDTEKNHTWYLFEMHKHWEKYFSTKAN